VVALVGENGSGTTTLAKVLSGLYAPDEGLVLWDGVDVATRDPGWIYQRVAVLFQDLRAIHAHGAGEHRTRPLSSGSPRRPRS